MFFEPNLSINFLSANISFKDCKLPDKAPVNEGYRLYGIARNNKASESESSLTTSQSQDNLPKGVPFYDYQVGYLRFNRDFSNEKKSDIGIRICKFNKFKHRIN